MSRLTVLLLSTGLLAACAREPAPFTLVAADPPAQPGALAPRLSTHPAGGAVISWVEADGAGHALRWSRTEGAAWGAARTAARGDDWFVNWADTPGVTAFGDHLVAHWLQKSAASTYAYDVQLARSADDGASWQALGTPHHDGTPTEHGFVSLFAAGTGFGLTWLDGRNTAGGGHDSHDGHGGGGGGMTLRAARFDAAGAQLDEVELDALTCDCCPTDVASIDGQPLVVYRDRTAEETRDIFVTRHDGQVWSAPNAVAVDAWHMPACPVNGPAADARGQRVGVAWFTAAQEVRKVQFAWSADGGRSFSAPVRIDAGLPVGRTELVLLPDGEALVLWLEQVGEGAELRARRVTPGGELRAPQTLAITSAARASGFPRAVLADDAVLLAWTEVDASGTRRVRAGKLAL
jgi:hypothetical protein